MDPLDEYPAMMTPAEVATYLSVSVHTLKAWRGENRGPRYIKLGEGPKSGVRYPREDVRRFTQANAVMPTQAV